MKKIIFVNGCFDLLHIGHIKLLKEAKKLAGNGKVIVAINSDKSRVEWGRRKPVIPAKERKEMLLATKYVDEVIIHKESSVYNTIKKIMPDIIVKGSDWKGNVVGQDLCKVYLVKRRKDYSTTKIIKKIRNLKVWK